MSSRTSLVLVETVSLFRHRYVIETPAENPEFALDDVVMKDAKEFSQEFLDENIVSYRVISEEEALALCDSDNLYASKWTAETKKNQFFTTTE